MFIARRKIYEEEILQEKGINYMDLALCAFAGLGVEVIYAFCYGL